jgi:hypothetical protein
LTFCELGNDSLKIEKSGLNYKAKKIVHFFPYVDGLNCTSNIFYLKFLCPKVQKSHKKNPILPSSCPFFPTIALDIKKVGHRYSVRNKGSFVNVLICPGHLISIFHHHFFSPARHIPIITSATSSSSAAAKNRWREMM